MDRRITAQHLALNNYFLYGRVLAKRHGSGFSKQPGCYDSEVVFCVGRMKAVVVSYMTYNCL
eukprot:2858714-Amphidinium_carterae.1